jgi:hypothetical protein
MSGHREKLEELAATFLGMTSEAREQLLVALSKRDGECTDAWLKILYVKHLELLEKSKND